MSLRVLFDGWPLAREPDSPPAAHLLALLNALPDGVEAFLALPAPALHLLPTRAQPLRLDTPNQPAQRLRWEQSSLVTLAARVGAGCLHLVTLTQPLGASIPVVVSPATPLHASRRVSGLAARLRASLSAGASARVAALLWPADLPPAPGPITRLPPLVHLTSQAASVPGPDLPDAYILYHGRPDPFTLQYLIEGWRWIAASVGINTPLVLPGLDSSQQALVTGSLPDPDLHQTVLFPRVDTLAGRAEFLQRAAVAVCLDSTIPWGDPLLEALAAGKAVVAAESELTAARCGPAAYLVPPADARALGAAVVTLAVETEMAAALGQAALQRAQAWASDTYPHQLLEIYHRVCRPRV